MALHDPVVLQRPGLIVLADRWARDRGGEVLAAALRARPRLAALGIGTRPTVLVTVFGSAEDVRDALGVKAATARMVFFSYPSLRVADADWPTYDVGVMGPWLRDLGSSVDDALAHELAHAYTLRWFAGDKHPPSLLVEGIAQAAEGLPELSLLRQEVATGDQLWPLPESFALGRRVGGRGLGGGRPRVRDRRVARRLRRLALGRRPAAAVRAGGRRGRADGGRHGRGARRRSRRDVAPVLRRLAPARPAAAADAPGRGRAAPAVQSTDDACHPQNEAAPAAGGRGRRPHRRRAGRRRDAPLVRPRGEGRDAAGAPGADRRRHGRRGRTGHAGPARPGPRGVGRGAPRDRRRPSRRRRPLPAPRARAVDERAPVGRTGARPSRPLLRRRGRRGRRSRPGRPHHGPPRVRRRACAVAGRSCSTT